MSLGFCTWILFSIFCISSAQLKTHHVDDLCSRWPHKTLWLKKGYSGILASVPSKLDSRECTITLMPEPGFSVVLSVYKFSLSPGDQLTITDYQNIQETLIGEDKFPDEQWSFTSVGALIVRYSWNTTELDGKRQKFQFIFTHVHDVPCGFNEFECKNKKCISYQLVCDRHNHCGDNSDQENCVFQTDQPKRGKQEGEDVSGEYHINKEYKFNKCRKFIMVGGDYDGKIGGTGPCFYKGKQVEETPSDDFSGENKINKGYKSNKCRKFVMVGGNDDGKIGGTGGPCFYKGPWKQPKMKTKTPTHVSCRSDEFQCKNLNCIAKHYICDGHNNCGDNSDEKYCYLKFDFGFECGHTMLGLGVSGIAVFISLFDRTFGTDATRSGVLAALSSM